ncbi:hypothetical protein TYRP_010907 [Tyrophagus putrescentiae]|nr:hypothetical protein TYRP_010907 [Tyrophagus putrescentiae]
MTVMMLYRGRSGKSITSQTDRHIKVTGNVILVKWQWNARRRSQTNPSNDLICFKVNNKSHGDTKRNLILLSADH